MSSSLGAAEQGASSGSVATTASLATRRQRPGFRTFDASRIAPLARIVRLFPRGGLHPHFLLARAPRRLKRAHSGHDTGAAQSSGVTTVSETGVPGAPPRTNASVRSARYE